MNLLEKAKQMPKKGRGPVPNVPYSKEELALLVAYFEGTMTISQYAHAMGYKNIGNVTHRIGALLKEGYKKGWVTIKFHI